MSNKLDKNEKEALDNRIVLFSSVIIIYALLLLFVKQMADSSVTVSGAVAFMAILRWTALVGAMACAAWSAYKENFGFFSYCGICIYVFFSTSVLLFCNNHGRAYKINFLALAVTFVLVQIYNVLKCNGAYGKKAVKILFWCICLAALIFFAVLSIVERFRR